jgi:hypothetical protein
MACTLVGGVGARRNGSVQLVLEHFEPNPLNWTGRCAFENRLECSDGLINLIDRTAFKYATVKANAGILCIVRLDFQRIYDDTLRP